MNYVLKLRHQIQHMRDIYLRFFFLDDEIRCLVGTYAEEEEAGKLFDPECFGQASDTDQPL